MHQKLPSRATRRTIPPPTPPDAPFTCVTRPLRFGTSATGGELRSPRQRVRAGSGDQPLRHPVVDVAETLEVPFLVFDDVEEGAPVELHVGEVLEQDVV